MNCHTFEDFKTNLDFLRRNFFYRIPSSAAQSAIYLCFPQCTAFWDVLILLSEITVVRTFKAHE